jgi:phenylalanyl-tRNA synthetase beta chain
MAMKVILSWVKDFVDISLPLPELARRLTMAGLEVEGILLVGLPMPQGKFELHGGSTSLEVKVTGISWEPDKIVVAEVSEVMPHPNADRLVLCKLNDGEQEHIVLTGAPNLYPIKGMGPLSQPLKVAYAKEGAKIYDGHQAGQVLTTLKRLKIRGVDSYSMICSEKELGISEDHEGVIILDQDAPVGTPLVDYMGDAVLEINIIPNIARVANMFGVAREVAALTGVPLRMPDYAFKSEGTSIQGRALIEIRQPELNPRFVLGLIEDATIQPSPYWMQRRLRLAGMRPINNIVDITNYVMLEVGQPLHAFDYDVLLQRAGGKPPTIITRTAQPGEKLKTLDDADRQLDDYTVLVCDTAGALSIAGVMGGMESEVNENTRNVLLEGAAWNFINIRKTVAAQKLLSEAAYRFSRGVHPAMAERGVRRALELMRQLSGGVVAQGLVDNYPLPPKASGVELSTDEIQRWLGITLSVDEAAEILRRLEFAVEVNGTLVRAIAPDHRLDIGEGITGKADLIEEIARVYGYDRIPETRMADELPPQRDNPALQYEEQIRDLLVEMGLQEVVNYRLTSPDREARRLPPDVSPDDKPYVRLANPIASDRFVLRHSLLSSLLEVAERNARLRERMGLFEIGPIFLASEEGDLPDELHRLSLILTGPRSLAGWQKADTAPLDFYDLKGILEGLFSGLRVENVHYQPSNFPIFHPGKCARVMFGERECGVLGELHPLVREHYDLPPTPLLAADLDLDLLLNAIPAGYAVQPVPSFPPTLEDLAVVVEQTLPADRVEAVIRLGGGKMVKNVRLFDVYTGAQVGLGKKSLAYSLTYQADDRTLTDKDAAQIRQRIIRRLEQDLGATIRS